jgi:hypothetical protein
MRSSSATASGETDEHTRTRSVPSCCMTSNLRSARRRFAASTSGRTASKSRKGWYRSMDRPRSAHRARTSAGDHGEATMSGSKISTPSKPADAAAASLSSSVPEMHTVASAVRTRVVAAPRRCAGTVGRADTDIVAPWVGSLQPGR